MLNFHVSGLAPQGDYVVSGLATLLFRVAKYASVQPTNIIDNWARYLLCCFFCSSSVDGDIRK